MPDILLIGAGFKNKGAEAMALTAVRELQRRYPDHQMIVASYAREESIPWGSHSYGGKTFELIPNAKRILHLIQVPLNALLRTVGMEQVASGKDQYLRRFADADLIVDLSGFALSDRRPWWRHLVFGFEILSAWLYGRPFVVFTQAMGPFERISTRLVASTCLPLASLVITRGATSRRFVEGIGVHRRTRVEQAADCAYLFPAESSGGIRDLLVNSGVTPGPAVGVVPNINIIRQMGRAANRSKSSYVSLLRDVCTCVARDFHAQPVLICHESHSGRRDDVWLAEQVRERYGEDLPIISASNSAQELKGVIGEMDLLLASRFHSLVAAISMGTPVVALGWAHKYQELMYEAGLAEFVEDASDASNRRVLELLRSAWEQRHSIRSHLDAVSEDLRASAQSAFDLVAEEFPRHSK